MAKATHSLHPSRSPTANLSSINSGQVAGQATQFAAGGASAGTVAFVEMYTADTTSAADLDADITPAADTEGGTAHLTHQRGNGGICRKHGLSLVELPEITQLLAGLGEGPMLHR